MPLTDGTSDPPDQHAEQMFFSWSSELVRIQRFNRRVQIAVVVFVGLLVFSSFALRWIGEASSCRIPRKRSWEEELRGGGGGGPAREEEREWKRSVVSQA
jgi:hypothetical protein